MPNPKPDRLAKLEAQKKQLEARIAREQARIRHADRKADDRRKILLGAFLADRLERNEKLRSWVENNIFEYHQRKRDRDFLRAYFAALSGEPETEPE